MALILGCLEASNVSRRTAAVTCPADTMYMVKYLNMHSKHNLHKKHEWKSAETKGYSQRQKKKKNLIQFTMKSAINFFFFKVCTVFIISPVLLNYRNQQKR